MVLISKQLINHILGISFKSKRNDYIFIVFTCYLPPEGSSRGRDAQSFYAHLLAHIYVNHDFDSIFVCADFNSCRFYERDITVVDNVPNREILDKSINQHGHA